MVTQRSSYIFVLRIVFEFCLVELPVFLLPVAQRSHLRLIGLVPLIFIHQTHSTLPILLIRQGTQPLLDLEVFTSMTQLFKAQPLDYLLLHCHILHIHLFQIFNLDLNYYYKTHFKILSIYFLLHWYIIVWMCLGSLIFILLQYTLISCSNTFLK